MLRGRAELILCFLLGIGVFALFETVGSFHSSNCSYQAHGNSYATQDKQEATTNEQRKDEGGIKHHTSIREPFACSVFGLPSATRIFANENEGFVVGLFTLLLVFVTAYLVRATNKLWHSAEKTAQRQLCAYISAVVGQGWRQGANRGLKFEFRPIIVNAGQTPAYNVNVICGIQFVPTVDLLTFDYDANLPPLNQSGVLTLGKDQNRFTHAIMDRRLSRQELQRYMGGTHTILVFGKVAYRDVFRRNRYVNFSFSIGWWNKRSAPIWHTTIRHNDSN